MKTKKNAFTLLEMLVVIGIIGVLVGLATTSYSTAQKKARDAKRKSDLKSVQNCLEQYYSYNNNFKYTLAGLPTSAGTVLSGTISCGGTVSITAPTDPINVDPNQYLVTVVPSAGSQNYTITATLEQGTAPDNTFSVSNQQ